MTPAEYIESGLLELYVSGAATTTEQAEVEAMAAAHPEIKEALGLLMADMERFAEMHAVAPAPELREKILGRILTVSSGEKPSENGKVVSIAPASSRWKSLAIAASVAFLLSIGFIIYQTANNTKAISELQQLAGQSEKDAEAAANARQELQQQLDATHSEIAFLRNPMTQTITLNSIVDGHPMKAMVHWNMESKMVAVDPMTLPATATDEKYVLWAIVDGKAVNEGGFAVSDSTGMMMMQKAIPDAEAFAISLEKNPEVEQHEGPIYVLGKPSPAAP